MAKAAAAKEWAVMARDHLQILKSKCKLARKALKKAKKAAKRARKDAKAAAKQLKVKRGGENTGKKIHRVSAATTELETPAI